MRSGLIEAGDNVGTGVQLDVDDTDIVLGSPVDRILQWEFAAYVDAYAVWAYAVWAYAVWAYAVWAYAVWADAGWLDCGHGCSRAELY
jgi:hypothetical protein